MKRVRESRPAQPSRAAAPPAAIDPAFAPVVKAFKADRRVALGKMFSSKAVLNVGGKIFAMCVKGNLVVKLPKARVEQMTAAGVGRPFDPGHGRLMKEWISVADGAAPWLALAREARAFVGGRRGS